ncbi:hypothetical protein EF901_17580, partial [Staphylococcus aureus]
KGVLDNGSMTVDMNNPTCGDRIRLTFDIENGIIRILEIKAFWTMAQ